MTDTFSSQTLYSIQYLRFVAAAMVVVVHATFNQVTHLGGAVLPIWGGGETGVDLFFVISGFVMVLVSHDRPRRPGSFLVSRFARVAPPYWIVTGLLTFVAVMVPGLMKGAALEPVHTFASFVFLPWENSVGNAHPVLVLGWTLNMEMWFYAIFAVSLMFTRSTLVALGIILCLVVAGMIFRPTSAIPMVWTSSLLLEFVFGMLIARSYLSGLRLPVPLAAILVVAGLGILLQTNVPGSVYNVDRWLFAGGPAALVVLGCVMLERSGKVPENGAFKFLGDISYSLYICHYFILGVLRIVWPQHFIGTLLGEVAFVVAGLALSVLSASAFYILVERPLLRQSRKLIATSQ